MRRRARRKANDLTLNIEIRSDGAQSLSYADDTFDVVITALVFCTVPDVEAALDEVSRVLKPGGEFRFLEHIHATGRVGRVQNIVNPLWHRVTAGCNLNRETITVFGADERFELQETTEPDLGLKLVTPFVRGTLLRTNDHSTPSERQSGQLQ
jgi:ubiquinone/menaquinone biosynthesis C-methylase UbiE